MRARRSRARTAASRPATSSSAAGNVAADRDAQTGVDFVALKSAVTTGAYALRKPRIAMYQRYGGGNMDEGWTRLMFEQFNVPFKSVMDAEIKAGGLEAKFDTIILPADSVAAMTGERPPAGGRRWRRAVAAASAAVPTTRQTSSGAASAPTA